MHETLTANASRQNARMQVLVIGAGVVGLAVARAAARKGHDVVVAEAANAIGTGISSRNSEVIHGGMYYATGTLRGRHCVRGRRWLYEFCASHGVPHRKCGKLIVATNQAELDKIGQIEVQGGINGVEGLELIGGNAARAMEPELACIGALHSPETGIIDGHRYMLALRGDLEDAGGAIAFNTPVTARRAKTGNGRSRSAAAAAANLPSTRWPIARGSARNPWRAPWRTIRQRACRGWCWPRAIISPSRASRRSRG